MRATRTMAFLAIALIATLGTATADNANTFASLKFRNIGPTTGRIDAVAGVPGDPTTYFAGGLGGLWRTTSGGVTWTPVFDKEPVTSIGAIAVAPSNHKIVYVGTGEPNIRNDIAFGDGVWRSDDGGTTWKHLGLDATSQIAQVYVDPRDANVVYICAVGDPFKPGGDRGLYRTTDGGKTWQRVLYVDDTTGASSVAVSPTNAKIVYAGMWTMQRRPWMLTSGGSNDGLYRSTDGGLHFARVSGNGFPAGLTGRIGVRFAPSDSRKLYAMVESKSGVFWSSDDGGYHWKLISDKHGLQQRPYYFSQFTVDPKDPKHIFFMSIQASESKDSGKTVTRMGTNGYDHHQMWIDPERGYRAVIAADAGLRMSIDGGKSWRNPQLMVAQAYHISVDDRNPYTVCGEFQDPGAVCAPNYSFTGSITPDQWFSSESGESGWTVFSPANDNLIYGTGYQEYVVAFDRGSMQGRTISPWPDTYSGLGADSYRYRGAWVAPLAVSPLEPNALYYGSQFLLRTDDAGQTWSKISPDLTRDDKSKQIRSGRPITSDNAGTEVYDTIASIAESPITKGEIWVGTDDGLVWVTRDGGLHWSNVTASIPNLPEWARINNVDPSSFNDGTAYIIAEAHKLGDRTPYLYATHDFGAHWQSVRGDLPRDSYARMLRADPVRKGLLYAGTENGLWVSLDDGAHWRTFLNNLAHVPIYDFVIQKRFDDLVVGTHGRGIWILDDVSPLQRWTPDVASAHAYLFPARDAYRINASWGTWATGEGGGDNPQGMAVINFSLHDALPKKAKLKLQIYDGVNLVRSLDVEHPDKGLNRAWWDLSYDPIKAPANYHAGGDFSGPQVLPGTYTVRLSVNGKTYDQALRVLPDPKTPGTAAQMKDAFALAMHMRTAFHQASDEITALQKLDAALEKSAARNAKNAPVAAALAALRASAKSAIGALCVADAQSGATSAFGGNGADVLRLGARLLERLVNAGEISYGNDYPPTAAQTSLVGSLQVELADRLRADDAIFGEQLTALNALLVKAGQKPVANTRSK